MKPVMSKFGMKMIGIARKNNKMCNNYFNKHVCEKISENQLQLPLSSTVDRLKATPLKIEIQLEK